MSIDQYQHYQLKINKSPWTNLDHNFFIKCSHVSIAVSALGFIMCCSFFLGKIILCLFYYINYICYNYESMGDWYQKFNNFIFNYL